jgi:nucleotide-binding universal stress UspA family protein
MAIGIGLSPSIEANITEAARLCALLGEKLFLIHVEALNSQSRSAVEDIVAKLANTKVLANINYEICFEQGDISESIIKVCEAQKVDLLLAGALPREGLLRYYMGSVARQLVRKSSFSILLLTNPRQFPKAYSKIVVTGNKHPKTPDTIEKTIQVAEALGARKLSIVDEVIPDKNTKRAADNKELERCNRWRDIIEQREAHRLNLTLAQLEQPNLEIKTKVVFGKPGYSIGHFTQSSRAELLVLNSPDTKLGFMDRVFTHDLEYILSELPSDLLIIHSHSV